MIGRRGSNTSLRPSRNRASRNPWNGLGFARGYQPRDRNRNSSKELVNHDDLVARRHLPLHVAVVRPAAFMYAAGRSWIGSWAGKGGPRPKAGSNHRHERRRQRHGRLVAATFHELAQHPQTREILWQIFCFPQTRSERNATRVWNATAETTTSGGGCVVVPVEGAVERRKCSVEKGLEKKVETSRGEGRLC